MESGLYCYRNSVCVDAVLSVPQITVASYIKSLKERGIIIELFHDRAGFTVLGVKSIKVPQKARQSWDTLVNWLEERIAVMLK